MTRIRFVALALFALAALTAACSGELVPTGPPGPVGGTADAAPAATPDGGGPTGNAEGEAFFTANVQPLLAAARPSGACELCHEQTPGVTGPYFMGTSPAENYDTMLAHTTAIPGGPLVGATAAASGLIARGPHTGNAFCTAAGAPYADCTQDEVSVIAEWIQLEAGN